MTRAITHLGDPGLLLPIAGLLLLWLAVTASRQVALRWFLSLPLCLVATASLRLLFHIGRRLDLTPSQIPSGHVSGSTLIYGAIALISFQASRNPALRAAALAGGVAIVGAVAVSRLLLRYHTLGEVTGGLLVGLAVLAWFGQAYRRENPIPRRWPAVLAGMAVLMAALHGAQFEVWPILERFVAHLQTLARTPA